VTQPGSESIQTVDNAPIPQDDPQAITTLQVSVRRVVVDVTVTDAHGNPVKGLTQSDFHVFEDGVPQALRSFEIHTIEPKPPVVMPPLPKNTFSNFTSAPSSGPVTVILYDLLNTPIEDQMYAHEQLLSFLRQRKTGGQVAVFVLSDKLHMLQGFTDDDTKLIAALNLQKSRGYKSTYLQTGGEASQQSDLLTQTSGNQNAADSQSSQDAALQNVTSMLKNIEARESQLMLEQRVDITAEALEQIAQFLIALPGRKNLLWMSASFPSGIIPGGPVSAADPIAAQDTFVSNENFGSEIVKATNMLNLSHVAVYPIDARGLKPNSMFSAAGNQSYEPGQGKDLRAVQDFHASLAAEHATMDTIGDQTGGRAFYNTNGLKEAAAKAIEDGSLYYSVSYTPSNSHYDGTLRKVRVQLNNPGYQLHYRHSYFANGREELAREEQASPTDALAVSLQHGAPAAHELFFEAHVVPDGAPVPATPEMMSELVKYEALATTKKKKLDAEMKTPIMMQPYVVNYGLLTRQLNLRRGPDGNRRDTLEFAALAYNDDGLTMYGTRLKIQDVVKPERYLFMLDGGYHLPQKILVPVGARSLRLAVRDASTGQIGSMEIGLPLPVEANAESLPAQQPPPTPKPTASPAS
jgi:VWFA-related protein